MTLTRNDIVDLLSAAATVDLRKVGEADVTGWSAMIRQDLDRELAFEALRIHYATSSDRIMPAHINQIAIQIRKDRAEREDRLEREQRAALNDQRHGLEPVGAGSPIALNADGPPVPGAYEINGAIDRDCPTCEAEPMEPCTNPINGQARRMPCPSRMKAAA
ncbi:hypothetical protein K3M35_05250 [Rhodococcus sp. DMU2021]|uniref:zinc finger domain-containing protein n=1 Tax=Rhodococcus sp. DMU2021 TaxID=2866997 RepID=UPI001C7DF083|nr:hypothetical protein [Rhodococcus sp. DMU2021]MBX4168073.1 hypothetical protein [Rhodococcus sp. DMU2021]